MHKLNYVVFVRLMNANDESGRQYIQKGGMRFYFDDAEYCAEEVKNMLKDVSI